MPDIAISRLDGPANDLITAQFHHHHHHNHNHNQRQSSRQTSMSGDHETTTVLHKDQSANERRTSDNSNSKIHVKSQYEPQTSPEEEILTPVTPDPPKSFASPDHSGNTDEAERSDDTTESNSSGSASRTKNSILPPPQIHKDLQNMPFASNVRSNRSRIVSLDGGRRRTHDKSSHHDSTTDDERRATTRHSYRDTTAAGEGNDDSPDSSDDDSSYFATDLPSPKTGPRFSFTNTGSVTRSHSLYASQSSSVAARESDASLSFSDESDDDFIEKQTMNVRISPMIPPKGTVADMLLYPQRITRMHSVSSLVSSGSSDDRDRHLNRRTSSGSVGSSGTSRSDITTGSDMAPRNGVIVTLPNMDHGRTSPILAQPHEFYGDDPSYYLHTQQHHQHQHQHQQRSYHHSIPQQVSRDYAGMIPSAAHTQSHGMTTEKQVPWMSQAASNGAPTASKQGYMMNQPMQSVFANMEHSILSHRTTSDATNGTLPFVYSEDDDTEASQKRVTHAAASGSKRPGYPSQPPASQPQNTNRSRDGGGGGGGNTNRSPSNNGGGNGSNNSALQNEKVSFEDDAGGGGDGFGNGHVIINSDGSKTFKVYKRRWVMLMYMSILNLLSDWTCYSVAPIALLTQEAFGDIDPERLVVIFLGANAVASACEPIILARLGLKRTVLFGSLMLMFGSIIKSGGMPPIIPSNLQKGDEAWRLYLGFFLVGLSQPLYQCTPALLSASWFPEKERTMATGVALNANQLGIGFAFVFGTLLVSKSDDIPGYFGLLSIISTVVFFGTLFHFDDAPPTPPSDTARVMRGTLEVSLPNLNAIVQSVRVGLGSDRYEDAPPPDGIASAPSPALPNPVATVIAASGSTTSARRRVGVVRGAALAPSPAFSTGSTKRAISEIHRLQQEAEAIVAVSPSPMMPGRVGQPGNPASGEPRGQNESDQMQPAMYEDGRSQSEQLRAQQPDAQFTNQPGPEMQQFMGVPPGVPGQEGQMPQYGSFPHPHYQYPYYDPRFQQQVQQQQAYYQQQYMYHQQQQAQTQPHYPPQAQPYYYNVSYPPHLQGYEDPHRALPSAPGVDEGAEPLVTFTPHHLDIDIRDDQVFRSIQACFSRPGFIHSLVAFAVSGIVINTLSTFMDYLVRLNGAPRTYTGIIGGTFQFIIMISSLIVGSQTDKTRAYYSVIIGMLVLGAFGLAECGVSLDSDRGSELRWALLVVAALVGPLQPVSTELGVDVVYPLSENTVLVIQQLFSNLLSAIFIPCFKAMKDIGTSNADDAEMYERPEYTFSFYLLIVLHAAATVFFATFNGRYLRYEHELQKQADEEVKQRAMEVERLSDGNDYEVQQYPHEAQPLMTGQVI